MKLWKTTIVIWSEDNPSGIYDLEDMARESVSGDMYCSKQESVEVPNVEMDQDWDGTEFFLGMLE